MHDNIKKGTAGFGFISCLIIFSLLFTILPLIIISGDGSYYEDLGVSASSHSLPTVIIDAGHGGEDCGAIGITGVYEKDLNLEIANVLKSYLEKSGYITVMTRTEDRLLYTEEENIKGMRKICDLRNRGKIANSYENAILISIHMNSYSESKYSGLQVYYGKSEGSYALASDIQSKVKTLIQPANERKVKLGESIYLMENSVNPAVLIECGFITNEEECKKLSEKEYQKELCFSILCGIIKYNDEISS